MHGYQFVDALIDSENNKHDCSISINLLLSEFVKYLKKLREYDDPKYLEENMLKIDEENWEKICDFRRAKILLEFKIQVYRRDSMDRTNLLHNLLRYKQSMIEHLKASGSRFGNPDLHDDPIVKKNILILSDENKN